MEIIKKLPTPFAGLVLGVLSFGSLFKEYSFIFNISFIVGGILLLFFIIRMYFMRNSFKYEMTNPVLSSILGTFSMAIMVFSIYLIGISPILGKTIFWIGFSMHASLILWFSIYFLPKKNIEDFYPSIYVVYVGISIAVIPCVAHGIPYIGKMAFFEGIIAFVLITPLLLKRLKKYPLIMPLLPSYGIIAAPCGLLLTCYIMGHFRKEEHLVILGIILTIIMYIFVFRQIPKILKNRFVPSLSGITFPFIISASGIKYSYKYLLLKKILTSNVIINVLYVTVIIMEVIAFIFLLFTFLKYIEFLFVEERVIEENESLENIKK